MLYKKVKCYYQKGMPIWCGNWPQDRPMPENVTETTCDAIVGPDGRLHHWANYADFRHSMYPPIDDQLDAVYKTLSYIAAHGVDVGPDGRAWLEKIKTIKEMYPKARESHH